MIEVFYKAVALFWIGLGVFWFIKPGSLKGYIKKKSLKKIRKSLFIIALIAGFYLMGISWKIQGLLSKVIFIAGIIAVFKGVFFLQSKASEKIISFWEKWPDNLLRVWALLFASLGVVLFFFR